MLSDCCLKCHPCPLATRCHAGEGTPVSMRAMAGSRKTARVAGTSRDRISASISPPKPGRAMAWELPCSQTSALNLLRSICTGAGQCQMAQHLIGIRLHDCSGPRSNFLHHSPRLQTAVGCIALARHPHHYPTLLCTHSAAEATEGVCAEESVISLQPWKHASQRACLHL